MLLLIAAFAREFAGLGPWTVEVVSGLHWGARTEIAGERAILIANGAGRDHAAAAAREVLSRESVRAVISTGFAGALDPEYLVGDVFIADSVRGSDGQFITQCPAGASGACGGVRRGALVTVDRVVQSAAAKRELWRQGGQAVDMEAVSVAAVASEHSLPFFCIRAISDVAGQDLPVDFNRALRDDGTISSWNVIGQALWRCDAWAGLVRLRRDAVVAAASLGTFLRQCEFPGPVPNHASS